MTPGARRAITAHRAATERYRRDVTITIANWREEALRQRREADRIAAETRARGVEILTSLTPEQREADKLDELLTWPARWTS